MTVVTCALGIPIDSVGRTENQPSPFGTELMPGALRSAGMVDRLGIPDRGDLALTLDGSTRDPESGLVAWPSLAQVTRDIRTSVSDLLFAGERPLLLGGCCAMLPGAVAGLRDATGTAAVINIDGHLDLYDAKTSPTGEGADVPISTLLGLGVPAWSQTLGPEPVLAAANVALVGHRDFDEAKALGSTMPEDAGITGSWDVEVVRQSPTNTADAVLQHLDPTPYWVHLDLDVLDEAVLPATDYLMPGGLTWALLGELLDPLVHGAGFRGLSLACLNPEKDPGGRCAQDAVNTLVDVLS